MACYAYEVLADPILEDHEFDRLGEYIAEWWDCIDHPHKKYIDGKACAFTSSIKVPYHKLPLIVLNATHALNGTRFEESSVYADAIKELDCRTLI